MYTHDIGELASGAIQSTSLSAQEKASFFEKSFVPGKDYKFSTQILPKKDAHVSKFLASPTQMASI